MSNILENIGSQPILYNDQSSMKDHESKNIRKFNNSIFDTFTNAHKIINDPALAFFAFKTIQNQRRAEKIRSLHAVDGLIVPPIIIFSITKRCNLRCVGCYHHASHRNGENLTDERISELFDEAEELGVSIIPISGGEPLTRPEIIDIAAKHPRIIFPIFTNGLLIDDSLTQKLQRSRNIIPMISIEGNKAETDARRGLGIFDKVVETMNHLKIGNIFFGVSITVTRLNFEEVTKNSYVNWLIDSGVKIITYVEYIPLESGTEDLMLNQWQRERLQQIIKDLQKKAPALFISFPGDEDSFGGCLAAGRGFLHISNDGRLEPCPASPFSDTNIKDKKIKDALNSPLLIKIRSEPKKLESTKTGCALLDNKEWVQTMLQMNHF